MKLTEVILILVLGVGASQCQVEFKEIEEVVPLAMIYLGDFEGKRYYRENVTGTTQLNAKTHCESQGMQLVGITSTGQLTFIRSVIPNSYHWTASKATGAYYSIVNPTTVVTSPTSVSDSYITCLAVASSVYSTILCSGSYQPLCYF